MPLQSLARKKAYCPPKLNKLTPEQANLILIGHATSGDQGATELLEVLYPSQKPESGLDVPAHFEEEEPAQAMSGVVRLIRRALTAFQSTREDFRRLVRG